MKLEKYLADYIEHEHDLNSKICLAFSYPDGTVEINTDVLQETIKQGLDAFESTEDVRIRIESQALLQVCEQALDELSFNKELDTKENLLAYIQDAQETLHNGIVKEEKRWFDSL